MNSARFPGTNNTENTMRAALRDFQQPAYAASIAVVVKQGSAITLVQVAQLTGALSLTANVGDASNPPMIGDELHFAFASDASIRVITFSTGFASAGTLSTVASKKASAAFRFDGVAWVEMFRSIGA